MTKLQKRLLLLIPTAAVLLVAALYLLRWPTLTPEGTLRRMERAALFPAGEVVAQGGYAFSDPVGNTPTGNYYIVSRSGDRYAVAVLERFWGSLYRPATWQLDFYVSGQRSFSGTTLELFDLGNEGYFDDQSNHGFENQFLVLSRDPAIVRVEVTQCSLPLAAQSDPVPYIEAHGVAVPCTQVAPDIWRGQTRIPDAEIPSSGPWSISSGPWSILRGYDAAGNLIYEHLPTPR